MTHDRILASQALVQVEQLMAGLRDHDETTVLMAKLKAQALLHDLVDRSSAFTLSVLLTSVQALAEHRSRPQETIP